MIFTRLRGFLRGSNIRNIRMSCLSSVAFVPDSVRGMKHLNREKFLRNLRVPVLNLSSDKVAQILPICKSYMLKLDNFKPVQSLNEENRCIHLNPDKVTCWKDISEDDRQLFSKHDVSEANLSDREIQLTYDNFKYNDIFKAVLPEGVETVSGFSQIGHIIHLNLRDHLLEYKKLIGAVLVDKIKTCRTVVNKSDVIDNTYRNFKMEVLAGDEDFLVTVKENRCNFQFDFSKVYWNPRLCKEHERVLSCLKPGDVLFDVFCGVGPFAVPAARKKCRVFANDLNPDSFKWLFHNAEHNKVNLSLFKSYNLDGKDFICKIFKDFVVNICKGNEKLSKDAKIHVTMNLPAMAVEFLKYFKGLIEDEELKDNLNNTIIVYVYCFAIGDNPIETAKQMVNDNMGLDATTVIQDVFHVRNVSPKKEMMKVTLQLTKEVLFASKEDEVFDPPPYKKKCVPDRV